MFNLGVNDFSDMTYDEFKEQLTGFDPDLTQIDDQSVKLITDHDEIWLLPRLIG